MAILLGLLAALLWGGADFLVRVTGRSLGVIRAMLYTQFLGLLWIGVWVWSRTDTPSLLATASTTAWVATLLAACLGVVATVALYRGLQVGRIGVVSPLAGGYGAVAAILSLLGGEVLSATVLAGLLLIAAAAAVISAQPGEADGTSRRVGLVWGGIAAVTYGAQFWVQGRFAVPALGPALPVWLYYGLSAAVLTAAALYQGTNLSLSRRDAAILVTTAATGIGGFAVVSAGLATGHVAVVTALSSLQSVITVVLACLFVGERLSTRHWASVAVLVLGLVLVRVG